MTRLVDGRLPEHTLDGLDVWPLLTGQTEAGNRREAFYYYAGADLHAIRSGPWKLHFPHAYRSLTGEDLVPAAAKD